MCGRTYSGYRHLMTSDPQISPDDIGIAAWAALLRTHAAVLPLVERDVVDATALPLSWYDVLLELNAAPERQLRMQSLAERVVLSRTRVSRLVGEIEAAGMVERRTDPDDGRATLAAITATGRRRLRSAAPVYLSAIHEHFSSHLSERQLRAVRDDLMAVLDALGEPAARER